MVITSELQLFQILKQKSGDKEAEVLVTFVDAQLRENNEQNLRILATKEDLANLRVDVKQDIANVRTEIAMSKADMIKWFVALFITLALMIIGLYFKK